MASPDPSGLDWDLIAALSSAVIALAALLFSVFSFKRQLQRAEAYERASVKPLLSMRSQNYLDHKSIRVANYGVGPAVITDAAFTRHPGDEPTSRVVELFDLPIVWQHYVNLPEGRAIPAGGEVVLVEQTLDHLLDQGIDREKALAILADWRAQKHGIRVQIAYQDIYGNPMPPLQDVLA